MAFTVLLASTPPGGVSAADISSPAYPANPAVTTRAIYVSSEGVLRVDPATLEPVWRALPGVHTFEPVVTPDVVLVGSSSGLYALDPATGRVVWQLASDAPLFSPTVRGGVAFVGGEDGSLRAVDVNNGRVRWTQRFDGWVYPPAVTPDRLVVGGGSHRLHGVDPATGAVTWEHRLDQELVYRPVSTPNGRVVITTFAGDVSLISAGDGAVIWRKRDPVPSFSPAIHGEHLYLGAFDGVLRTRRLRDGALLWQRHVGSKLPFPPHPASGVVLVGSDSGVVAAFAPPTGRAIGRRELARELAAGPRVVDHRILLVSPGGDLESLPLDGAFAHSVTSGKGE